MRDATQRSYTVTGVRVRADILKRKEARQEKKPSMLRRCAWQHHSPAQLKYLRDVPLAITRFILEHGNTRQFPTSFEPPRTA